MERYGYIRLYLGLLFIIMAPVMVVPVFVAFFGSATLWEIAVFLFSGAILLVCGLLLRIGHKANELKALDFNESSIVVFLTWLMMTLVGAVPYMLISGMSFSHAVFDSVSGWTTTGLSLLNIPEASLMILFYRGWCQFIGGAGFAIIMLASLTGVGAQHTYSAEGKGTLIKPNVLASARIVVTLYLGYFVFGTIAYLLCGLSTFDVIVYCFCAISTGGFGNQVQNVGYFDSASVEFVSIVLMILGNLSFLTGYFIVKGKLRSIIRNGEVKVLFVSLAIAIPIVFLSVTSQIFASSSKALRVAAFETVSAITTTGFYTVDYNNPAWFDIGVFILTILQIIGGGTCSTAGGLKQYRIYMIYKSILWHIKTRLLPSKAITRNYIWEGDQKGYVTDGKTSDIAAFVYIYMALYGLGVAVILMSIDPTTGLHYSLRAAMFEFASALGTVGLSIGVSTVHAPLQIIWAETLGMFLGRLEIFVVIIAMTKMVKDSLKLFAR